MTFTYITERLEKDLIHIWYTTHKRNKQKNDIYSKLRELFTHEDTVRYTEYPRYWL